jgi:hypothetical protein
MVLAGAREVRGAARSSLTHPPERLTDGRPSGRFVACRGRIGHGGRRRRGCVRGADLRNEHARNTIASCPNQMP